MPQCGPRAGIAGNIEREAACERSARAIWCMDTPPRAAAPALAPPAPKPAPTADVAAAARRGALAAAVRLGALADVARP